MDPWVVTGGAGFIGRHVVAALRERGHAVRVLDLKPAPASPGVVPVCGSVRDTAALARVIDGAVGVIHLAAVPHLWVSDAAIHERVNVDGTRAVIGAIRSSKRPIRLVHCSSETVLVGRRTPVGARLDETARPDEADLFGAYARSKWRADRLVEEAAVDGLDACILLPTMPLGPGDHSGTPPSRMVRLFLLGRQPAYLKTSFNPVDVRDVAKAIVAAAERGTRGERYLVGGADIPASQFLQELALIAGIRPPRLAVPAAVAVLVATADTFLADSITRRAPNAPLDGVRLALKRPLFSSAKAARLLDHAPRPLVETLRDTVAWLRSVPA